jgi:PKD repeat protein
MKQSMVFLYAILFMVLLPFTGQAQLFPPGWNYAVTSSSHTFYVPQGSVSLNGISILPGDVVGVFYSQSNGSLNCGGYSIYLGQNMTVTAFGDDSLTIYKDGFSLSENVIWKVFHSGQMYDVFPTYSIGNVAYPNQGFFTFNGISSLVTLTNAPQNSQTYSIYGNVTYTNTGFPAINQLVTIITSDPNLILPLELFTDNVGNYSLNVSISVLTPPTFTISTYGNCPNGFYSQTLIPNTSNQVVANFNICNDTIINSPCQAAFTYAIDTSTSGISQVFLFNQSSNASGSPLNYLWDFGDGSISTQENPIHTYSNPGFYIVCLSVTSADGCFNQYCDFIEIGGSNSGCYADFYGYLSPALFCLSGPAYQFIDNSFSDYPIVSWQWDFGDNNTGFDPSPIHCYNQPGLYQVYLTIVALDFVTNDTCISTICQWVNVNDSINPPPYCQAQFFYDSSNPLTGTQFIDISSGGAIEWFWEFSDGFTSIEQNPVHLFMNPGLYNVCLTIYTSSGCSSSYCEMVDPFQNNNNCYAYFQYYPDSVANGIWFMNLSQTIYSSTQSFWTFGDGTSSTDWNPVHYYTQPGTYEVCLIISAPACSDTLCQTITVGGNGYSVSGYITAGLNPVTDAIVLLMDINGNMITAPVYQGYYNASVPAGSYLVYAVPSYSQYPDFAPTYYINALFWAGGTPVDVFSNVSNININLIQITNSMTGPGGITGSLNWLNFNSTNTYKSLLDNSSEGIPIILMDNNSFTVAFCSTDYNGNFEFGNLQYGTYKIYTELTGFTTIPTIVTLDESNPQATNISITISGNTITGIDDEELSIQQLEINPNPVFDILNASFNVGRITDLKISILNALGQVVESKSLENVSGMQTISFDFSTQKPGIYFLKVIGDKNYPSVIKFMH